MVGLLGEVEVSKESPLIIIRDDINS
jgi:hypothetical protein